MKHFLSMLLMGVAFMSCRQEPKEMAWNHSETIVLDGINPIGIAQGENGLWLSDGDHNRVVLVDETGAITKSIDSLDRPMHIDAEKGIVYIPQYGNDEVLRARYETTVFVEDIGKVYVKDSLDAPAGVSVFENTLAIADFYNNKIHYSWSGQEHWITFGKEGNAEGDFYYPTDVQITKDKIWVADAYNNRVQAFDKEGNFLTVIGAEQKMNAATGIYVSNDTLFVTDFENDRVLVFDLEGNYKQELKTDISKPTDMLLVDGKLYVTNYKGSSLAVYEWSEKVVDANEGEENHNE